MFWPLHDAIIKVTNEVKLTNVRSRVTTLDLTFVNFTFICNIDNGVMKSPKRREIIELVFTCLCITIVNRGEWL